MSTLRISKTLPSTAKQEFLPRPLLSNIIGKPLQRVLELRPDFFLSCLEPFTSSLENTNQNTIILQSPLPHLQQNPSILLSTSFRSSAPFAPSEHPPSENWSQSPAQSHGPAKSDLNLREASFNVKTVVLQLKEWSKYFVTPNREFVPTKSA